MGCLAQAALTSESVQAKGRQVAVLTGKWELKPTDLNTEKVLVGEDSFGAFVRAPCLGACVALVRRVRGSSCIKRLLLGNRVREHLWLGACVGLINQTPPIGISCACVCACVCALAFLSLQCRLCVAPFGVSCALRVVHLRSFTAV